MTHDLSPTELRSLTQHAVDAKQLAYCPYSNFRVGCAALLADGSLVTGANVESASFPVGTCAERCVLAKVVTSGREKREREIRALAVATDVSPPASPCGMCRQFIREFCPLTLPIFMHDNEGKHVVKTLGELLPMSFGPEDLEPKSRSEPKTATEVPGKWQD